MTRHKDFSIARFNLNNTYIRIAACFFIIMLFGNLNAVVDWFLHPEIPYFDREHIIVGGITGSAVTMLLGLLWVYEHHLKQSLTKIEMLESILPICLHCKKIQMTDANGATGISWQSIESYFTRYTATKLSHGICPDCARKHYPNFEEDY